MIFSTKTVGERIFVNLRGTIFVYMITNYSKPLIRHFETPLTSRQFLPFLYNIVVVYYITVLHFF